MVTVAPQVCAAGGGAGPAGEGQAGADGGAAPAAAVIQGAAAAGERGAGGQIRAVQHGARLGRGAEQAARPGHAQQGAAHKGPGHRDENFGEPPPREDQGNVVACHC